MITSPAFYTPSRGLGSHLDEAGIKPHNARGDLPIGRRSHPLRVRGRRDLNPHLHAAVEPRYPEGD